MQGSGESKWCKRQLVRLKDASKVKKEERAGWSEVGMVWLKYFCEGVGYVEDGGNGRGGGGGGGGQGGGGGGGGGGQGGGGVEGGCEVGV